MKNMFWTNEKFSPIVAWPSSVSVSKFRVLLTIWFFFIAEPQKFLERPPGVLVKNIKCTYLTLLRIFLYFFFRAAFYKKFQSRDESKILLFNFPRGEPQIEIEPQSWSYITLKATCQATCLIWVHFFCSSHQSSFCWLSSSIFPCSFVPPKWHFLLFLWLLLFRLFITTNIRFTGSLSNTVWRIFSSKAVPTPLAD